MTASEYRLAALVEMVDSYIDAHLKGEQALALDELHSLADFTKDTRRKYPDLFKTWERAKVANR